jgi:hypothetical protein
MYLWEAAAQAAERLTSAVHQNGVFRIRQATGPDVGLVFEFMERVPHEQWVACTRDEAMLHFPRAGWHVGRERPA